MGSGSSKASSKAAVNNRDSSPRKPVANVNKPSSQSNWQNENEQNIPNSTNQSSGERFGSRSPMKAIEVTSKPNKKEEKKEKKSKNKKENENSTAAALVFEDDSDMDNDIDEVLRIPLAVDNSRNSRDKDKKKKKDNDTEVRDYNYNSVRSTSRDRSDDPLPETYAQRLQRQQYKLQQETLIRQKTIHRNSREWDIDDDYMDPEENINSEYMGFDASKFRAANKGDDVKREIFKTPTDDFQTPRYLQSDPGLDEMQVTHKPSSPVKSLPRYNQSELDLMMELEQDLL